MVSLWVAWGAAVRPAGREGLRHQEAGWCPWLWLVPEMTGQSKQASVLLNNIKHVEDVESYTRCRRKQENKIDTQERGSQDIGSR